MRLRLLLVAIGVAIYANALGAPFEFDDLHAIVENPHLRQLRLWPPARLLDAAAAPPQSALSGRPVASLSLALNYALGGLAPAGYHACNLAVHIAAALLLFTIVRRHLEDRFAFLAAAVWLVHPLQTEVVDYTTQRTESMMALSFLATLDASIRGWSVVAAAACALGMATKESMATAPLLVLLYDATFASSSIADALRRRPRHYAALVAAWLVLLALNVSGPRSHTAGFSTRVTALQYALSQTAIVTTYLKLIVWPHPLILDYGPVSPVRFTDVWPSAVALIAVGIFVVMAVRRRPPLAFLAAWFFITLAPASSIVPIATEVGAERRMYLPLAAVAVLAAVALRTADAKWHRVAVAMAAAAVVLLAAVSIQRNTEFSTPVALWEHVLAHRPHARARNSLGLALQQAGRRDEAIAQFRLASREYPPAHYNLGRQLAVLGQSDAAIGELAAWLRAEPNDLDGHGAIADLLLHQGQYAAAAQHYAVYVKLAPTSAAAHNNFGLALVHQHRVTEAIHEFRTSLALAPGNAGASQNLAHALQLLDGAAAQSNGGGAGGKNAATLPR